MSRGAYLTTAVIVIATLSTSIALARSRASDCDPVKKSAHEMTAVLRDFVRTYPPASEGAIEQVRRVGPGRYVVAVRTSSVVDEVRYTVRTNAACRTKVVSRERD